MRNENELREIIRSNERLMAILRVAREVELQDWAVAAGAIRNVVWDQLHGYEQPTPPRDVDLPFFDPSDVSRERDKRVERRLVAKYGDVPWDVANQAGVHLWYEAKFGYRISPIQSVEDGLGRNPDTASAVGARLEADDALTIMAPWGLSDLFEMILRPSPKLLAPELFHQRLRNKRFTDQWPRVKVFDA